ncbi:MAG TPA: CDP-diacylglycerol--glycerol-3-phosphate 3-phosphatidyltransferase [Gammaproteobacteria bacterium]|nr:CDP-diacylglycerol--glycerol-3-phosphate 3-phosphatidyltransferase [Gammaproteobacteria bacterium]
MRLNIPNSLTVFRILLIPVFVAVFYLPFAWANAVSAAIFALAAITDWLDGFLARTLNQTSRFGAFLDPVADKLMVAAVLVLIVQADPRAVVAVPAIIIIGREIAVSALREFMALIGERTRVKVAVVGKVKTTAQMLALLLMLYRDEFRGFPTYEIGFWLLYLAAALTLWSMIVYMRAAWPIMGPNAMRERSPESLDTPRPDNRIRSSVARE